MNQNAQSPFYTQSTVLVKSTDEEKNIKKKNSLGSLFLITAQTLSQNFLNSGALKNFQLQFSSCFLVFGAYFYSTRFSILYILIRKE